jgi:iron complex outermembrane receptor protein
MKTKVAVLFLTVATASAAENDTAPLEEVVITGTSIKRINAETALPVQVLKAEDIERTGASTAEELMRSISSVDSAGSRSAASNTGAQTGAISTISLRGLTSARTLVLIDGKRSTVYGGSAAGAAGSSVDIGSIPVSMIERVEVLKDGASAIYGSDAIAGVVNFILKKGFQGVEVTAEGGTPTHSGGGTEEKISALAGTGDIKQDRYNVELGLNFEHQNALMGSSRAFATRYSPGYGNDVTSSFAFPANAALTGGRGTRSPGYPNCGPDSFADVNFANQCRFDNSPFDSLVPQYRKLNANLNGSFALTDASKLYADAAFSQLKTVTTVQPVPLSYQNPLLPGNPYNTYLANLLATKYPTYKNAAVVPGTGAFLLGPDSPYYPVAFATANGVNGQPLNLIYRDFANGLRNEQDTANTVRVIGGIKGTASGWDYDTSVLYSEVRVKDELLTGFPLYSQIMPLLDSGVINPFGPTTDPNALAAAKATEFTGEDISTKTSLTSLSGTASRKLIDLPAGPLAGALGLEVRRETYDFNPALAVQLGDIAGQGGNTLPESASRTVESGFLEFNAPLLSGLEADAAVRYDHYQTVGSTVNPKGSLRWQPVSWFLLRGAVGSGFRAPSLTDLYAPQGRSVTGNGTRDPIQCATFNSNNPSCSFQFTTLTGGNPNLKPEKSHTFTLGTVIEPVHNLTVDVDSFWLYLKDQIVVGGLNYAAILQNAQTATQFADLITRDATGTITAISQVNANLFKTRVSGVDFDVRYAIPMGDAGTVTLTGNGSYFYKYDAQNADGTWTGQLDKGLNAVSNGGIVSRFRYNATALYAARTWNVSLTQNYQKRYRDSAGSISLQPRRVSAYDTVDAQAAYTGLRSFTFTVGVRNLFDKVPPYANYASSTNNFVGGYDITYGDPLLRFVYARVKYTLH